jgi:endonuclease/exonuclease/phosphatase family metal-dependent hydrolase
VELTIATWNVLADAYIRPSYFPLTEARHLDPAWRQPAVAAHARALAVDVLCLQEADVALVDLLGRHETHHYASKGLGKPDGCATIVSNVGVHDHQKLEYADESGHVALVVTVTVGERKIAIANTHLRFQIGLGEVRELLAKRKTLSPDANAWVIVGDFNVEPKSDVTWALADAGFVDLDPSGFTCNSNLSPKRIDYVFASAELAGEAKPLPPMTRDTALPNANEPSDHRPVVATVRFRSG